MNWQNVKLIFSREVRDQLRDRRTLFMIAVLPLVLYPALGIGMVRMTVLFNEQPRTVVILGAEHLPDEPPLLQDGEFVPRWFPRAEEAEQLNVVTDLPGETSQAGDMDGDPSPDKEQRGELLQNARKIRDKIEQRETLQAAGRDAAVQQDWKEIRNIEIRLERTQDELARLFASSRIQVLILVPPDLGAHIHRLNEKLASRQIGLSKLPDYPRPKVVRNSADDKSRSAYEPVKQALNNWEKAILGKRLEMADLPSTFSDPIKPDSVDIAEEEQLSANLWSKLFPALLVIMAVTGAFYPAIDLGAGEKERGTIETLLICPAKRPEIVLGKFFTVLIFSIATVFLNLASMGLTAKYMVELAGSGALTKFGSLAFPGVRELFWVLVLLVPLAALFSALCLALATFARSSKEGQYYLTPLLMVTLGLTVFCISPGVEIQAFYSVMPVVGPALLLKQLLSEPENTGALWFAVPVLMTSIGYSLLALWWAVDQFSREEILFREAERFELRLWIRHILRDKEPTPSFTEAGFCFLLIMLLQFASLTFIREAMAQAGEGARDIAMMRLLMIQQLVIIASPALFMALLLTTDVFRTLRLRWPRWPMFAVAAVLPVALHPLSLELSAVLQKWFFLPLPKSVTKQLEVMADPGHRLWLVLLSFAVVPAVCEELAFRGFILSGFGRSKRTWLAIGLSSLTFGVLHMIPQQVFNATLLGLVLGLLAIRSNSLLPAILFHFIYNSLQIVRGRLEPSLVEDNPVAWFIRNGEGGIRYEWPTLVLAAVLAIVLLRWLVNQPNADSRQHEHRRVQTPEPGALGHLKA